MAWGTDIMMLGKLRTQKVRGFRGAVAGTGAVDAISEAVAQPGAAAGLAGLGALSTIDFPTLVGGYLGALVAGGAIGYIVSPGWNSTMRGGLAAGGIRHLGYVVSGFQSNPVPLTAYYGLSGALSLWYAWSKRKG